MFLKSLFKTRPVKRTEQEKKQIGTACQMLRNGYSVKETSRITELPDKEVKMLKRNMQKARNRVPS